MASAAGSATTTPQLRCVRCSTLFVDVAALRSHFHAAHEKGGGGGPAGEEEDDGRSGDELLEEEEEAEGPGYWEEAASSGGDGSEEEAQREREAAHAARAVEGWLGAGPRTPRAIVRCAATGQCHALLRVLLGALAGREGCTLAPAPDALGCEAAVASLEDVFLPGERWLVMLYRGGYFAGVVVQLSPERSEGSSGGGGGGGGAPWPRTLLHKRFARYTTRRKQGGSQSAHDKAAGRPANSIGAQIRRANEAALQRDITQLLRSAEWAAAAAQCRRVLLSAAATTTGHLLDGVTLCKGDARLARVPLATGRPTIKEAERVAREVARCVPLGAYEALLARAAAAAAAAEAAAQRSAQAEAAAAAAEAAEEAAEAAAAEAEAEEEGQGDSGGEGEGEGGAGAGRSGARRGKSRGIRRGVGAHNGGGSAAARAAWAAKQAALGAGAAGAAPEAAGGQEAAGADAEAEAASAAAARLARDADDRALAAAAQENLRQDQAKRHASHLASAVSVLAAEVRAECEWVGGALGGIPQRVLAHFLGLGSGGSGGSGGGGGGGGAGGAQQQQQQQQPQPSAEALHSAAEQLALLRGMAVDGGMSPSEVCFAMGWEGLAAAVSQGCRGVDWAGMLAGEGRAGGGGEEGLLDLRALAGGGKKRGKGGGGGKR